MELTEKKEWKVDIEGIPCKVVFWTTQRMKENEHRIYPHKGIWNSYVYLDARAFPDCFKKLLPEKKMVGTGTIKRKIWSTWKYPIPMAYGITWADVKRNIDGKFVGVEIGNDYNHICNEHEYITEETILADLKETIAAIKEFCPTYLVYSHMDGQYVKPTELEAHNAAVHARLFPKKEAA